jgi:hypothetical protein
MRRPTLFTSTSPRCAYLEVAFKPLNAFRAVKGLGPLVLDANVDPAA